MTKNKIWLSTPHMGGAERNYIDQAFAENWIAPMGPNVTGFEQDLKDYLFPETPSYGKENNRASSLSRGQGEVAALSSGTAALHLALILLGVKAGDEVLCQSLTFAASANPITYLGATPVFIDSEKETLNICPEQLELAIKDRISNFKKPKAIIAVHLYGTPYKVDAVQEIATKYDIPVVEDAAEALGSSYKGRKCGTIGEYAILSFNGNKIITTSGGGALVTGNEKLKQKAVFLATQARDNAPHYQHTEIGYNYRLSNISAGIGRGQMQVLDEHVRLRRKMHTFYTELFAEVKGVKVHKAPGDEYYSNHWLSVIFVEPGEAGFSREDLRIALEREQIESRPLWKPMHLQPVFTDAPFYGSGVAEELFKKGLCLASGSNLTDSDRHRISGAVEKVISKESR